MKMNAPMPDDRVAAWRAAQGEHEIDGWMEAKVELGPILSDAWQRDPKRLLFTLARYKFVAKMLKNCGIVAEIGAGDGFGAELVRAEGNHVDLYDIAPLSDKILRYDVMSGAIPNQKLKYDAVYSLDVLEHVKYGDSFVGNAAASIKQHGKLIIGAPSLESQVYASEPSRKLHINCMSGEDLRTLALRHFHHVFMFSMNDETVHTGFMPLAHYLFAVCAEPIR
jgi:Methyltransferase domain